MLPAFIGLVAGIGICTAWYFISRKPAPTALTVTGQIERLDSTTAYTYRAVAENEETWTVKRDGKGRAVGVTVHRSVKTK